MASRAAGRSVHLWAGQRVKRQTGVVSAVAVGLVALSILPDTAAGQRSESERAKAIAAPSAPRLQPLPATRADRGEDIARLRTRTSRTYEAKHGSYELQLSSESVNYRDVLGRWQPIDNRLEVDGEVVRNGANRYQFAAPRRLAAGDEIRVDAGDAWVAFVPRGARGQARVEGSTVTYDDAWPGVSLRYTATGDTVREELVIEDRASARDFDFDLRTPVGTVPQRAEDGATVLRSAQGAEQLKLSAAWMVDAAGARASVAANLVRGRDGWSMRVSPDRKWLGSSERKWPVLVDPTVVLDGVLGCTIVKDEDDPEQGSYCGEGMLVGEGCAELCRWYRTLVRFDLQDAIPAGGVIEFATLTGVDEDVTVGRLTTAWTSAANWDTKDGSTPWSPTSQGWYLGGASEDYQPIPDLTQLVKDWVSGTTANHGLFFAHPTSEYDFDPQPIDPALSIQYAPTEDPESVVQEAAVDSYLADEPITVSEAQRRLRVQDRLGNLLDDLEAAIDVADYGGIWIDDANGGRIKIAIETNQPTPPSGKIEDAEELLEDHDFLDEVDFVAVAYSLDELEAEEADFEADAGALYTGDRVQADIDTEFNHLVVSKANDLNPSESAALAAALADMVVAYAEVAVQPGELRAVADVDECGSKTIFSGLPKLLVCDGGYRGGMAIFDKDPNVSSANVRICTGGYVATHVPPRPLPAYNYAVLTAGHCLYGRSLGDWYAAHLAGTANASVEEVGTAEGYSVVGPDAAKIQIDPLSDWADSDTEEGFLLLTINRDGNPPVERRQEKYRLRDVRYTPDNVKRLRLCVTSGPALNVAPNVGRHTLCGKVGTKGHSEELDPVPVETTGLGTLKFCMRDGSSGGPVFRNGHAYGMYVGREDVDPEDCDLGYYSGAKSIESTLNVQIVTTG